MWWLWVVLIIVAVIWQSSVQTEKTQSELSGRVTEWKTSASDKTHCFECDAFPKMIKVFFDEDAKTMTFFVASSSKRTSCVERTFSFNEIVGCVIRENGEISGGVGRAVVGGVIAGAAGAVVGANTAKQKIKSCQLVILLDSISEPEVVYELLEMEEKRTSKKYETIMQFTNNVKSAIQVILNRKNAEA